MTGAGLGRWKRWWWAPAAAALAVAVAAAVVWSPGPQATRLEGTGGRQAPTFAVPDLRHPNRTIELADFEGRPVVLNFWASWCVPCRRELPAFQAAFVRYGGRIAFLGMNHQDSRADALDLLAETGVRYSSGYDPEGKVAAAYRLLGMPTTVLITADGRIAATRTGEMSPQELDQALRELAMP